MKLLTVVDEAIILDEVAMGSNPDRRLLQRRRVDKR